MQNYHYSYCYYKKNNFIDNTNNNEKVKKQFNTFNWLDMDTRYRLLKSEVLEQGYT